MIRDEINNFTIIGMAKKRPVVDLEKLAGTVPLCSVHIFASADT